MLHVRHFYLKFDWLYGGDLGATYGTRKEDVGGRMAFDAVVAEDVAAPYAVRHDGPLRANPAL